MTWASKYRALPVSDAWRGARTRHGVRLDTRVDGFQQTRNDTLSLHVTRQSDSSELCYVMSEFLINHTGETMSFIMNKLLIVFCS